MDGGTIGSIVLAVMLGALLLFGIVFGIIAAKAGVIEDPEKSIKIKAYLSELFSYGFRGVGVDLVSILTTHFIFLAGPIIDFINQSFQYSIASIVGFLNVILVSILGSTRFAELSKSVIGGIFPGTDPTRTWSTWSYTTFTNWKTWLYLIPAIALLFVPTGMLSISNNYASYTAIGIGALAIITYIFMPLASAGYLGYIPTESAEYGPATLDTVIGDLFAGGGLKIDPEYGFCELPGFSYFQNALAPVSVVLSQTVLWCHISEMIYNNNQNTTSSIILSTVVLLAQWITLYNKGCFVAYRSGRAAPLVGLGLSVAAGFLAYYIIGQMNSTSSSGPLVLHVNTESFTSSSSEGGVFHPPPKPASKTPSKSLDKKIVVGPQTETSEPVDDQDAFVCEAYKDGELITSTIVD